ncbi:MAG TPA: proton-conducting transporter membrane subunit [Phycisphaerae bacterium]|jgi:NADH-quinone oxidoreductase subunit L
MAWVTIIHMLLLAAALPLVGFLVLLVWGRRLGRNGRACGAIGTSFAMGSFACSVTALVLWASIVGDKASYVDAFTYRWISIPNPTPSIPGTGVPLDSPLHQTVPIDGISVGCLIDSLTVTMFLVLTLINLLVHGFALGTTGEGTWAQDGDRRSRFFALLQFLNFAMLAMLLANSLVQLLIFWELLGVAAYFLLRYGQQALPDANTSRRLSARLPRATGPGMRMFLMNAGGDAALIIGLGILVLHTQSLAGLSFFDAQGTSILSASVRATMGVQSSEFLFWPGDGGFLDMHWLTWMGICFLVAAFARMAQFPFQTWMHDAAEGPAPATALLLGTISLAAGTYLIARIYPIFTMDARFIAAVVGCVTLATAALVALVQSDIRKILAWSTVSQGGYILLFLGAGGYSAGILHLFTHGFIKTALFLAAGSIIYGISDSAGDAGRSIGDVCDIRQLGGLWKRFPITAIFSLIAVLALAGAPWMSGAYSTNHGLACVYDYAHALQGGSASARYELLLFEIPAAMTYVTALGIGRWWWLIFAGVSRNPKLMEQAHESPFATFPIIILAGFSIGQWFEFSGIQALIGKSIPSIILPLVVNGSAIGYAVVLRVAGWAFVGLALAAFIYMAGLAFPNRIRHLPGINGVDYWLRERMFLDDLYESLFYGGVLVLSRTVRLVEWTGQTALLLMSLAYRSAIKGIARIDQNAASPPAPEDPTLPGTLNPKP